MVAFGICRSARIGISVIYYSGNGMWYVAGSSLVVSCGTETVLSHSLTNHMQHMPLHGTSNSTLAFLVSHRSVLIETEAGSAEDGQGSPCHKVEHTPTRG